MRVEEVNAASETGARDAIRLTDRDLAMLAWIARHRIATHEHVCERFVGGREGLRRRLGLLAAAGFLERRQVLAGKPSVYLTTRLGLAMCGSELPPATLDLRTFLHDIAVTQLGCELECAGHKVTTEREMRSAELTGAPVVYSVAFQTPAHGRSAGRHFPDLIVHHDDGLEAIEYEIAAKGGRRLRAILEAYLFAQHITRVTYYAERAPVRRRLETLGRELHLSKLTVRDAGNLK